MARRRKKTFLDLLDRGLNKLVDTGVNIYNNWPELNCHVNGKHYKECTAEELRYFLALINIPRDQWPEWAKIIDDYAITVLENRAYNLENYIEFPDPPGSHLE
jgi:hypothetical protein